MGNRSQYAYGQSRYLRAEDLAGKAATVVISAVEDVEFDKGLKPVLHFKDKKKGVVVNATNYDILAAAFGNNTVSWPGHTIILRGAKVRFKSQTVDSIVVEVPAKPAAPQADDDLDDGIPDDLAP
jgi:hypothetical protein